MAKKAKEGANKSQLIRSYIAEHPEATPRGVAEAMAAQGVEVSAQFVSTVKSNDKKKGGKAPGKRGPKPKGAAAPANGFATAMPLFQAAGDFLKLAGDKATAQQVLEMVAALRSS